MQDLEKKMTDCSKLILSLFLPSINFKFGTFNLAMVPSDVTLKILTVV